MAKFLHTPGYFYDSFGVYRLRSVKTIIGQLTEAEKQKIVDYWRLERNNTDAEIAAVFNLPKSIITSVVDGYIKTLKIGFKK
jgi:uncharacterized protein YcaQ